MFAIVSSSSSSSELTPGRAQRPPNTTAEVQGEGKGGEKPEVNRKEPCFPHACLGAVSARKEKREKRKGALGLRTQETRNLGGVKIYWPNAEKKGGGKHSLACMIKNLIFLSLLCNRKQKNRFGF